MPAHARRRLVAAEPSGRAGRQGPIAADDAEECARLMGLPDSYRLPKARQDALQLVGDGVAVPMVRHLAEALFEPLLDASLPRRTHRPYPRRRPGRRGPGSREPRRRRLCTSSRGAEEVEKAGSGPRHEPA
ncbi:DNA cytosine methyltransferase [Pseudoroseomonas wenyumeiae]